MRFENQTKDRLMIYNKAGAIVVDLAPYAVSADFLPADLSESVVQNAIRYCLDNKQLAVFEGVSKIKRKEVPEFLAISGRDPRSSSDMNIEYPSITPQPLQLQAVMTEPNIPTQQPTVMTLGGIPTTVVSTTRTTNTPDMITRVGNPLETQTVQPVMLAGHNSIEADMFGTFVQSDPLNKIAGATQDSFSDMVAKSSKMVTTTAEQLAQMELNNAAAIQAQKQLTAGKKRGRKPKINLDTLTQEMKDFLEENYTTQKVLISKMDSVAFLRTLSTLDTRCAEIARTRLEELAVKVG